MRILIATALASLTLVLFQADAPAVGQTAPVQGAALAGQITSAEEGPMEGVLVSAKRAGSTMTITVASDAQGRYSFPASSWSRASTRCASVPSGTISTAPRPSKSVRRRQRRRSEAPQDRRPRLPALERRVDRERAGHRPAEKLAAELHRLPHARTRVKSRHSADDFMQVIPRMQGYANQSIPAAPQLRRAERLMEERGDQRVQVYRGACRLSRHDQSRATARRGAIR